MGRKTWSIAIGTGLAVALGASLAGAASAPKTKGTYFSVNPSIEISVGPALKYVTLYTSCGSGDVVNEYWDSAKIPFGHNAFSYDKRTTVQKVIEHPFSTTPVITTVLATGQFTGGKFKGKVQIAGSSCPEKSYSARYSAGGGGEGR